MAGFSMMSSIDRTASVEWPFDAPYISLNTKEEDSDKDQEEEEDTGLPPWKVVKREDKDAVKNKDPRDAGILAAADEGAYDKADDPGSQSR